MLKYLVVYVTLSRYFPQLHFPSTPLRSYLLSFSSSVACFGWLLFVDIP